MNDSFKYMLWGMFVGLLLTIPFCTLAQAGTFISGSVSAGGGAGLAYESYGTGAVVSDNPLTITGMNYDAGDLVVVSLQWSDQGSNPTTVTDGTNTWTASNAYNPASEGIEIANYWCVISSSQTGATITITFSDNMVARGLAAVFTGSFDASPVDIDTAPSSNTSSTTFSHTSGAFSQATEVVFVALSNYNSGQTCTADAADGFTEIHDVDYFCTGYKIISATDSLTVDVGLSGTGYGFISITSYTGS